jgi:CrcB protein
MRWSTVRGELVAIFAGGVAGALIRTVLIDAFPPGHGSWSWPTFAVNVAGAFVLGFVVTAPPWLLERFAHPRALIGIGFCGALTTFSTLQLELLRMLDDGRVGLALLYVTASVGAGLAAVTLADTLARHLHHRRVA